MSFNGDYIKNILRKGRYLIYFLKDSCLETWASLSISQRALVITFAFVFSGIVSTFVISLDRNLSPGDILKFSDNEVVIEILTEEKNTLIEEIKSTDEGDIQPDTYSAFDENSKSESKTASEDEYKLPKIQDYKDLIKGEKSEAVEEILAMAEEKQKETKELIKAAEKLKKRIINQNSTVKYNLKNREAVHISVPTYTCENKGVMVVNITVNERGRVVEAVINVDESGHGDGCLEKNAIEYAKRATFTPSTSSQGLQKGTITFLYIK